MKTVLTQEKAENNPAGGVLVGKREGQTMIHDKGTLGGYLVGKLHKEGGIKGINKATGQPIEVQGGEVIITAPAVSDTTKREFEGEMLTNREILSRINEKGGGVSFANGGEMPTEIFYTGASYNFGGETLSDYDILQKLNECACEHEFEEGGKLLTYDAILKKIKEQNKSTYPKIPTKNIFLNEVEVLPYEILSKADKYVENPENLPTQYVSIESIVPTQRNVTVPNIKSTKNVSALPILFFYNDKFYVLDGHHRVSNAIFKNQDTVLAYVYDYAKNNIEFENGGQAEFDQEKYEEVVELIKTELQKRGKEDYFYGVSKSDTDYGKSWYVKLRKKGEEYTPEKDLQVRISDHSVHSTSRLFDPKYLSFVNVYEPFSSHDAKKIVDLFFERLEELENKEQKRKKAFDRLEERNLYMRSKSHDFIENLKANNKAVFEHGFTRLPESDIQSRNPSAELIFQVPQKDGYIYYFVKENNGYGKLYLEPLYFNHLVDLGVIDAEKVEEKIYYASGGLLASNGKPSNLTPEQYKLVRTPEFKAWFGDWENDPKNASKVVDENGEPLVVYHGTNYIFNIFNENYKAHYFSVDKKYADFVIDNYKGRRDSSRVLMCFLNIRKLQKVKFSIEKSTISAYLNDHRFLKELNGGIFGFDDIEESEIDKLKNIDTRVYVVLNPTQIKLADGSNTTFDADNPDIRFNSGGAVGDGVSLGYSMNINTPINVEYVDDDLSYFEKGGQMHSPKRFWGEKAGGVLIFCTTTNRFLLLRRSNQVYEPNTWGMVSGMVDNDDISFEEAVKREAKEEIGFNIQEIYPSYVYKSHNFVFQNFISFVDKEFTPILNWENQDYKWVKLEDFPKNLHFGLKLLIENEDMKNLKKMKQKKSVDEIDAVVNVFEKGGDTGFLYKGLVRTYWEKYNIDILSFVKLFDYYLKARGEEFVEQQFINITKEIARTYIPDGEKLDNFINDFRRLYNNKKPFNEITEFVNSKSTPELVDVFFDIVGLNYSTQNASQPDSSVKAQNSSSDISNAGADVSNLVADISRLGIDVYEFEKASSSQKKDVNDLMTLAKLLPSFNQSKFSVERAQILKEMNRLKKRIDNDRFFKQNENEKGTLFTPHGLLDYYYTQTIQIPTKNLDIPCELPTPNGAKSKLPLVAYLNVRTPQFKNWFGDWEKAYETNNYVNCSVLIDEETKEPKIFYHGVRKFVPAFGSFSNMGEGVVRPYGSFEPPSTFPASYFAENEEYAKFYGGVAPNMPTPSPDYKPFIYKVFIRMKNPVDITPLGFSASYKDLLDYLAVAYGITAKMNRQVLDLIQSDGTDEKPVWVYIRNDIGLLELVKDYGFDGFIQIGDVPVFLPNGDVVPDRSMYIQEKEFLTFAPSQIKSATVKKSFYFEFFNDIRFKQGGYVRI